MKVRISLITSVVAIAFTVAYATDVGGIIDVNTTWTEEGSPYYLNSIVQIADNVTLTIEEGVVVDNLGQCWAIQVWGKLKAIGNSSSRISFNCILIQNKSQTASSEFRYCNFNYNGPQANSGNIFVENCAFNEGGLWVSTPDSNSQIIHNMFINSNCFVTAREDITVLIAYNLFTGGPGYEDTLIEISSSFAAANSQVVITNNSFSTYGTAIFVGDTDLASNIVSQFNSFWDLEHIAFYLHPDAYANVIATQNFWNTTDSNIIDLMIYDRRDDLSIPQYLTYIPFLPTEDPNTPIFSNYVLTVQAEPNDANTIVPSVGQHTVNGLVNLNAGTFVNCPDVYDFDYWMGDVDDTYSAETTIFMDSDKTVKAVYVSSRQCGDECHPNDLFGDYNRDCVIDFNDFAYFANNWLVCTKPECD